MFDLFLEHYIFLQLDHEIKLQYLSNKRDICCTCIYDVELGFFKKKKGMNNVSRARELHIYTCSYTPVVLFTKILTIDFDL